MTIFFMGYILFNIIWKLEVTMEQSSKLGFSIAHVQTQRYGSQDPDVGANSIY